MYLLSLPVETTSKHTTKSTTDKKRKKLITSEKFIKRTLTKKSTKSPTTWQSPVTAGKKPLFSFGTLVGIVWIILAIYFVFALYCIGGVKTVPNDAKAVHRKLLARGSRGKERKGKQGSECRIYFCGGSLISKSCTQAIRGLALVKISRQRPVNDGKNPPLLGKRDTLCPRKLKCPPV